MTTTLGGTGSPIASIVVLKRWRSSAKLNRLDRRSEHLDIVSLEDAGFAQLDREVEPGLSAQRRQERVGPFALDDRCDRGNAERFEIDRVRNLGIGHDRRRVRIDEDDAVAFLVQRAARLDAGVVEFSCLTDDDRAGADDEDVPPGHSLGGFARGPGFLEGSPRKGAP